MHADRAAATRPATSKQTPGHRPGNSPLASMHAQGFAAQPCEQSVQRVHACAWSIKAHSKLFTRMAGPSGPTQRWSRTALRRRSRCCRAACRAAGCPAGSNHTPDHRQRTTGRTGSKQQQSAHRRHVAGSRVLNTAETACTLNQHTAACRILRWTVLRHAVVHAQRAAGKCAPRGSCQPRGVCVCAHTSKSLGYSRSVCRARPVAWISPLASQLPKVQPVPVCSSGLKSITVSRSPPAQAHTVHRQHQHPRTRVSAARQPTP